MRKIACIPLVVLLFACGGTSETVEKTTEEAQTSTSENPTATTTPPTTTSENPTTTTTPPTTTSEKPTTTIEVKNESTEFSAVCELEETSLTLFCRTNNYNFNPNSLFKWTSNATSRWGTSPEWEFILGDQGAPIPASTFVEIEECVGTVCRTVGVEIDTSTYSSDSSDSSESGESSFEELSTDNSLFHAGRLVQLPIDPYELVTTEATERFRAYGSSGQTNGSNGLLSNNWEFIGSPGASVYAPLSGNIVKVEALSGGTHTVHIANSLNDPDWVWQITPVSQLSVTETERVETSQRIGVTSEQGKLFLSLIEQSDQSRPRTDLPRYHCPLLSLYPAGFVQTQLQLLREQDALRLGIEAQLSEDWTPCRVTTPFPESPDSAIETNSSQLELDEKLLASAVWDPTPKPVPISFFDSSIAGHLVRLPVNPDDVIAHISTLSSHNPEWGKDVFHTFGHKRALLEEPGNRSLPDGSVVPATRFMGYDVNWYFLTPPEASVVSPLAGQVMSVSQLIAGEPDMSLFINQTGNYDWAWNIDHIVNLQVEAGDWVEPGDLIGQAAPRVGWTHEPTFASSYGFSISLVEMIGGELGSLHHCPLIGLDPSGSALTELEKIQEELGRHYGISPESYERWKTCITDQPIAGDRWSGSMSVVLDYAGISANP